MPLTVGDAPVLIWSLDPDGCHTDFSPALRSFFGADTEADPDAVWERALHPHDRADYAEVLRQRLEDRAELRAEYRLRRFDGTYRIMLDCGTPRFDQGGTFAGYVGSLTDLTDLRQSETLLTEQRALLEMIARDAPLSDVLAELVEAVERHADGMRGSVVLLDADPPILRWGAGDKLPVALRHEIDGVPLAASEAPCSRALKQQTPVVVEDVSDLSETDPWRAFLMAHDLRSYWSTPIFGRDGQPLGTFVMYNGAGRSPTACEERLMESAVRLAGIAIEHSRDAEQLRASVARHEAILDAIPDLIFRFDREGVYLDVNAKQADLLVRPADEVLGKRVDEVLPGGLGLRWRKAIQQALDTGERQKVEYTLETMSGAERIFEGRLVPVQGREAQVIVRDVTEMRRAEEALRESEKFIAAGRLAAGVAHEINNPLAGIKNAFQLVKTAVAEDHPYAGYVTQIEREIERIAGIVRQMYSLYRPEPEAPRPLDLVDLVQDVASLLEPAARGRRITLTLTLPSTVSPVLLPEGALRQILFNIVANALDASPEAGDVEVGLTVHADEVVLSVRDEGPGIPAPIRSRIFEPFFTTKEAGEGNGMGLGLSISKTLAEAMGGTLRYDTKTGAGTTFYLLLPHQMPSATKTWLAEQNAVSHQ